jgi:predicted ester cyclase
MTIEELRKIEVKWAEAVNTGDLAVIDRTIDEMCPLVWDNHNPTYPELPHTREGLKAWFREILNDMPDFHYTVEDMIVEGDRVATRVVLTGHNPLTGENFLMHCMHISRYAENKLVEEWELDYQVPAPVPAH